MNNIDSSPISELKTCCEKVNDLRKPQGLRFNLADLLAASILAILNGADDFTANCFTFSVKLEEAYYLVIGTNYYDHYCNFKINALEGIEYDCCKLDYTMPNWCY